MAIKLQSAAVTIEDHIKIMAIKEKHGFKTVTATVHYLIGLYEGIGVKDVKKK